jgi:hypothetical protein
MAVVTRKDTVATGGIGGKWTEANVCVSSSVFIVHIMKATLHSTFLIDPLVSLGKWLAKFTTFCKEETGSIK